MSALKNHRLVSQGWRIVRPDEARDWRVFRVESLLREHGKCQCWRFDKLWEAFAAIEGEA